MKPGTKRYVVNNFFQDYYNSTMNGNGDYYGYIFGDSNEHILEFIELFIDNDDSDKEVYDIFIDVFVNPNKIYYYSNRRIELLYWYVWLFYLNKKVKVLGPLFRKINKIKMYFLRKFS